MLYSSRNLSEIAVFCFQCLLNFQEKISWNYSIKYIWFLLCQYGGIKQCSNTFSPFVGIYDITIAKLNKNISPATFCESVLVPSLWYCTNARRLNGNIFTSQFGYIVLWERLYIFSSYLPSQATYKNTCRITETLFANSTLDTLEKRIQKFISKYPKFCLFQFICCL